MREVAGLLNNAGFVYQELGRFEALAKEGHAADATVALQGALRAARIERAALDLIFGSEPQTAQVPDLAQRPLRVICAIGVAQPHPHTSNDKHSPAPSEPGPLIA